MGLILVVTCARSHRESFYLPVVGELQLGEITRECADSRSWPNTLTRLCQDPHGHEALSCCLTGGGGTMLPYCELPL